jgi:hypothetical protein
MIGAIFALALQAADAPAPSAPPAASPPSRNAADAIGDILAMTPPDSPPPPAPAPVAPASVSSPSVLPAPVAPAAVAPVYAPPPEPTAQERARMYESGVISNFQAREARQGPLDGRWALNDADGKTLYMIQFADPGPGRGPVEGAWRDVVRQGAVGASGFLDSADRSGQALVLKFESDQPCVVTLTLGADGRWSGTLRTGERSRPVVMTRS